MHQKQRPLVRKPLLMIHCETSSDAFDIKIRNVANSLQLRTDQNIETPLTI